MKRGFTLAELLMVLGIIGVLAVISIPAISSLRPDKTKIAYLKVYDTITEIIKNISQDSSIYAVCKDLDDPVNNVNCQENPLFNTNRPLNNEFKDNANYQGDRKLCNLIAWNLGVPDGTAVCSDVPYNFNSADYINKFETISFVTSNGMRWRIVPAIASIKSDGNIASFQVDIYVDVDPSNNDTREGDLSCIYDQNNCKQPDIFKFMLAANGTVTPADPMGINYLLHRKTLLRREVNIVNHVITNVAPERNFEYEPCYIQEEDGD